MKNVLILLAFGLVFLSSCEKEVTPVNPANSNPAIVRDITVDYAIYAVSGDVEVVAIIPDANGELIEKTMTITRQNHTINFTTKSHQQIMIKARNTNPSHDEINVSIYVDGLLFKSNSTTVANGWAIATGTPQ